MIIAISLTVLAAALTDHPGFSNPPDDERASVIDRLAPLQQLSFATDREYCGYLGRNADGSLAFTEMVRGGHDGCTPELRDGALELVASIHTHGAYDPDVPAEFPTTLDMESDLREGVNGYIGTPGGRLWYIDSQAQLAVQLCGLGCLPQDPGFRRGDDGEIAQWYTYEELLRIELQE